MEAINWIKKYHKSYKGDIDYNVKDDEGKTYLYYLLKYSTDDYEDTIFSENFEESKIDSCDCNICLNNIDELYYDLCKLIFNDVNDIDFHNNVEIYLLNGIENVVNTIYDIIETFNIDKIESKAFYEFLLELLDCIDAWFYEKAEEVSDDSVGMIQNIIDFFGYGTDAKSMVKQIVDKLSYSLSSSQYPEIVHVFNSTSIINELARISIVETFKSLRFNQMAVALTYFYEQITKFNHIEDIIEDIEFKDIDIYDVMRKIDMRNIIIKEEIIDKNGLTIIMPMLEHYYSKEEIKNILTNYHQQKLNKLEFI